MRQCKMCNKELSETTNLEVCADCCKVIAACDETVGMAYTQCKICKESIVHMSPMHLPFQICDLCCNKIYDKIN